MGEQTALAVIDSQPSFITGCFDSQHKHAGCFSKRFRGHTLNLQPLSVNRYFAPKKSTLKSP